MTPRPQSVRPPGLHRMPGEVLLIGVCGVLLGFAVDPAWLAWLLRAAGTATVIGFAGFRARDWWRAKR